MYIISWKFLADTPLMCIINIDGKTITLDRITTRVEKSSFWTSYVWTIFASAQTTGCWTTRTGEGNVMSDIYQVLYCAITVSSGKFTRIFQYCFRW